VKNFPSLKSNSDFQRVYKNGKSYANKTLVMYVYRNELSYNRIGISVSKKNGNSVVRHTFTRKIREIFRLNKIEKKGLDIIVVVRVGADVSDYHKLEKAYLHLLKSHRLDKEDVEENKQLSNKGYD
jgi:ribonuclease P protein component